MCDTFPAPKPLCAVLCGPDGCKPIFPAFLPHHCFARRLIREERGILRLFFCGSHSLHQHIGRCFCFFFFLGREKSPSSPIHHHHRHHHRHHQLWCIESLCVGGRVRKYNSVLFFLFVAMFSTLSPIAIAVRPLVLGYWRWFKKSGKSKRGLRVEGKWWWKQSCD